MEPENNTSDRPTGKRPKRKDDGRPEGRRGHCSDDGRRKERGPGKDGRGPRGKAKRGGRKRLLAHGELRLLILNIIKTTPSHGYGLITEIKTLTSGFYQPSPGVIYPALEALQDLGWIEAQPDMGKRVLVITEAGRAELAERGEALSLIEARLEKLASPEQKTEPDDVGGALRRLKYTTDSNFKGKSVDPEARKAAVLILEDARKQIAELGETRD